MLPFIVIVKARIT